MSTDAAPPDPARPTPSSRPRGPRRPGWRGVLAVGGAVLALGVVLVGAHWDAPVTFGWFAYAPLAEAAMAPGPGFGLAHRGLLAGLACTLLGAVLVSGAVGFALGARPPGVSGRRSSGAR